MPKPRIQARAIDADTLEVHLYDYLSSYADEWGGISSKQVLHALAVKPDAKTIRLRVNSPGGDVFEGIAIYSILKSSPARIVVEVDGLAASAASFVAMAGDEIRVAKGGMFMIHEARCMYVNDGTSDGLREEAELLDKLNNTLVDFYAPRAEKAGKTRDEIVAAMAAETWLTAEEAIAWGLADSIADTEADVEVAAIAKARPRGRELFTRFAALAGGRQLETSMKFANIAKKLKLKAEATEEQVIEQIDEITEDLDEKDKRIQELESQVAEMQRQIDELLGASETDAPAEAVAKIRAGAVARTQLANVQAQLDTLRGQVEAGERENLLAKLRAEKKVTPAMERDFVATMSLDQLKAFAAVAPRIAHDPIAQPPVASALVAPGGKKWADMKPAERARLKHDHPELYDAMRAQAG